MNAEKKKRIIWQNVLYVLKKNGLVFLALGGLSLASAGVWYTINRDLDTWTQWLLIGGVTMVGVYLLLRPQDITTALSGRTVRYGSNALVLSLAVVGIVALLTL
jgi:hypothetical protein